MRFPESLQICYCFFASMRCKKARAYSFFSLDNSQESLVTIDSLSTMKEKQERVSREKDSACVTFDLNDIFFYSTHIAITSILG